MNNKLFFMIFSGAMVVLTLVTICTAPIINNIIPNLNRNENCQNNIDAYDYYKKLYTNPNDNQKKSLNHYKQDINLCKRRKAVYGLEFSSLIIDIFLGTLCCVLGLLHYFEIGNYCVKVTGIIGLASGVICFVITIVYVGYSAYIFDNDYSWENKLFERRANLHWENGKYVLPYNEDDEKENKYYYKAKFKELGKKRYNYDSKLYKEFKTNDKAEFKECEYSSIIDKTTQKSGLLTSSYKCEYIWYNGYTNESDSKNKYIYDRWLTSIILSCFIFVCAIGVAIFGLFLFLKSDSSSSSGHTPMK